MSFFARKQQAAAAVLHGLRRQPRAKILRLFVFAACAWLALGNTPLWGKQSPSGTSFPKPAGDAAGFDTIFDSWQTRDGLPSQTVLSFAETADGYLWIGTSGGLVRFDGSHFLTFTRQEIPALGYDAILSLLSARDGSLWIGADGGSLIRFKDGASQLYRAKESPASGFVRGILQDSKNVIWAATDAGLFRVEGDHLEYAHDALGLPPFFTGAAMEDHGGRLWVGGMRLFAVQNGKAAEYLLNRGDDRSHVRSLLETHDGSIWAGTVEGLYRLSPGSRQFQRVPGVRGLVHTLSSVDNDELWAGSISEGIYRIRGERVTQLRAPKKLIGNTVHAIFNDSDHNLWIGTQTGMMRLGKSPVRIVELPGNLDSDFATVSPDADGGLWVASNRMLHIQNNQVQAQNLPGMAGVQIRNTLQDRDRSLWMGTVGKGLYHVTPSAIRRYDATDGLVNNYVRSLTQARDGSLWIGTDNGLSHLDSSGFHNFTSQGGLAYNSVRTVIEDRNGEIWIGTDHGLSHRRGGAFVQDAATRALSQEKVWSLLEDSDGGIWIGTRGDGLFHFSNGRLAHFDAATGLVSDIVYSILEDPLKRLWIGTPAAVMLVNRDALERHEANPGGDVPMRIFPARMAGSGTQFYGGLQPSGMLARSGEACFPSTHGLWMIRPDGAPPPRPARLRISALFVDGQRAALGNPLTLPAQSTRFAIAYDLVLLRPLGELRSHYRLDGFDQGWVQPPTNQTVAPYTNLRPGRYTFTLEAWDSGFPQDKSFTTLIVVKRPYYYQTFWFWALFILLSAVLLTAAYYWRISLHRRRFREILAERARLAREVHDTLLQGCASVSALLHAAAGNETGGDESRLHMIRFASTQMKTTMDEARHAIANLRLKRPFPVELSADLKRMTERVGREHGIDAAFTAAGLPFALTPSTIHALTMVAREAVFNAILHANAQKIRVSLEFSPSELVIAVSDDGQGFNPCESNMEEHFGLQGMRERIAILGGELAIDSQLGRGTTVRVQLLRDEA